MGFFNFQTPHAVQWMRPEAQEGCQVSDWFNILVLHQNRFCVCVVCVCEREKEIGRGEEGQTMGWNGLKLTRDVKFETGLILVLLHQVLYFYASADVYLHIFLCEGLVGERVQAVH